MDSSVIIQLSALNRQFYQTFALQFSATRQRLQPGVRRVIDDLSPDTNLLDLGCGNGELAMVLGQRGHRGRYVGVDASAELLQLAQQPKPPVASSWQPVFVQADLTDTEWPGSLPTTAYQVGLAFAVLHHIPGHELRRQLLRQVHDLLSRAGEAAIFVHSVWQFLHSPRLRGRVLPWETIGLNAALVDEGDYVMDWRQGGFGLRYVHQFSEAELAALAIETGFEIADTFYSDGEGGRLGLYQIWKTA